MSTSALSMMACELVLCERQGLIECHLLRYRDVCKTQRVLLNNAFLLVRQGNKK